MEFYYCTFHYFNFYNNKCEMLKNTLINMKLRLLINFTVHLNNLRV